MKWLRKSLLLAALGFVGTTPAFAQTRPPRPDDAVVLSRPRPFTEPATLRLTVVPPAAPAASTPWPAAPMNRYPASTAAVSGVAVSGAAASGVAASAVPANRVPAFVVRGQMAEGQERRLPSAEDIVEPRVKPFSASPSDAAPSMTLVQAQLKTDPPAPDGSKTFNPPPPRPAASSPNQVPALGLGLIEALPAGATPLVIYDTGTGYYSAAATSQFYARAEYLSWWTKGYHLPVLVTTGSPTTPENSLGALGTPGTQVLYGGDSTGLARQNGARFMLGYNLDPCGTCGIEGGYFFLGRRNDDFFSNDAVLARPFFNVNTGMPDRELTSSPGALATDAFKLRGTIDVNNFSDLEGAELNARTLLCSDCNYFLYAFAGFRYLDLHEGLSITENVTSLAAIPGFSIFNPGNQIVVNDTFNTRNRFYGGQVGLDGEYRLGNWFVGGRVQLGIGVTHESVTINGSQTVTTLTGATSTYTGGLLALPSNIGMFSQNRLAFVPQIGLRIGYNLTPNLRIFAGYDFLYWSNVVRPGDQVDPSLNVTQIPNFAPPGTAFAPASSAVRPVVPFTTTSYYAHGVSAGLEWRY